MDTFGYTVTAAGVTSNIATVTVATNPVTGGSCNADGRELARVPSVGTNYTFDFAGTGLLDPRTTNCTRIRVDSDLGGKSTVFTYRLK